MIGFSLTSAAAANLLGWNAPFAMAAGSVFSDLDPSSFLEAALVAVYFLIMAVLCLYGLHLYVLVFLYRRRQGAARAAQHEQIASYARDRSDGDWPGVTTQLPIFNEADVAVRVIEAAGASARQGTGPRADSRTTPLAFTKAMACA